LNRTVKIVLIGPESTGKSTLTKQLAAHFNAPFVEEAAREYLEKRPKPGYELSDLEAIAKQQLANTHKALETKPKLLFCDTDLVTLHIWAMDKFDARIPFIENNLVAEKSDLYLLCKPDLPWEIDPLREDSTRRDELFEWNAWVLEEMTANVVVIRGSGEARLQNAINTVNEFLDAIKLA
jgi:NadR type nicotinamide-nucleotide adenylyltransferase